MSTSPSNNLRPSLKSALANTHSGDVSPDLRSPGLPGSALASPRASYSAATGTTLGVSGVGFPRTHTGSSTVDGKYRRKVGFEAFVPQPDALFTFTSQVSQVAKELGPVMG